MNSKKPQNAWVEQLSKDKAQKINLKLLEYIDSNFNCKRKRQIREVPKEQANDSEVQEQFESTEEEDTKDTNSDNKLSQKNQFLSFEDKEIEDLVTLSKFIKKSDLLQNLIRILWRKIWTIDVLNSILTHIFDYRQIKELHSQDRFLMCIRQMFQTVKMLSLFVRISSNEIYKYWWEEVKKKLSEIYVLKHELVRSSYDLIFDRDFFYQEIFVNWIPSILQNIDLKPELERIIKGENKNSIQAWEFAESSSQLEIGKESIPAIFIKQNLHLFYTAVITNEDLNEAQKSNMIKEMLNILGFQSDRFDVFNKTVSENKDFFMINVLYSLFRMLGIDREYYFEHLIARYNYTGEWYNLKKYTLDMLKNSKIDSEDKKYIRFMKSIGFINSALCNNLGEQFSLDIKLWCIEMMGKMFPEFYNDWRTLEEKQDFFIRIHKFYQIANTNCQKSLFFSEGLNQYFLSSLKYSLSNEYLVEINQNTLTDAFELPMFDSCLEKVLWFIAMSVLKYPTNKTIIEKNNKILRHYFNNEEQQVRDQVLYSCQFLLIKTIKSISEFKDVLKSIEDKLYNNEETASKSLIELSNSLNYDYNNDHKLHNLKYLNQLIEKNEWSNAFAKEAIQKEEVLKIVYENVMKLKVKLNNDIEDTHLLSLCWAKFIAAIGIGKSFISEGSCFHPRKVDKLVPIEPTEEVKKDNKYIEWDRNAWEYIEEISINREEAVIMGARIHRRLIEFIKTTSNPLKPYLYSRWRLEYEILNLIKGETNLVLDQIKDDISSFKIDENNRMDIYRLLKKFTNDSVEEIEGAPSYSKDSLGKFWANLVNHMNNKEFKSVFTSLNWLLKNEDIFILNLLMPYILYFSIRFSDHTSSLIEHTSAYFNEILDEGKESHVNIIF